MSWMCFNNGMCSDASVLQSFNASNGYLFERAWSWSDIPIGLHRLNVSISSEWAFVSMYSHLSTGCFTTVWARCCPIYLQCTVIFFSFRALAFILSIHTASHYNCRPPILSNCRAPSLVRLLTFYFKHHIHFVVKHKWIYLFDIYIYIFAFIPPFSHSRSFYVRSSFFQLYFTLWTAAAGRGATTVFLS